MTFILILLIIFLLNSLISKALFGDHSKQPTLEDEIRKQKAQEGKVTIYKNNKPKPPKPKITDLGKDVDFEEVIQYD